MHRDIEWITGGGNLKLRIGRVRRDGNRCHAPASPALEVFENAVVVSMPSLKFSRIVETGGGSITTDI
jgi:hypothetical protein